MTPNQLNNLGIQAQQQGQPEKAVAYLTAALQLVADDPQLHYNLGWVWHMQGNLAAAVACYNAALQLKPDYYAARLNLGVALGDMGQAAAGVAQLQHLLACQIAPSPEIYYNLGNLWRLQDKLNEAIGCYQQAIELDPTMAEAHHNLGVTWASLDNLAAAQAAYQQAIQYQSNNILWRLEHDCLAPAIMPPLPELTAWRAQFEQALTHYAPINLGAWLNELPACNVKPPFYLTYHGADDRPIKENFAALFTAPTAPHRNVASQPPYKIGFVVTKQHEGIFNKLMVGLLNQWSDPDLTPIIICPAESVALIKSHVRNERVTFFTLPAHLPTALTELHAAQFDLLYFWEVGTDSLNYFLPFFRLAPVQCTSWGIPATTGLPQMDYFISSVWLETAEADQYYRETLIRLNTLPVYYEKPIVNCHLSVVIGHSSNDNEPMTNDNGQRTTIYLCPQSLFKLHPDFDPILAEILRRDPQGQLWLIEGMYPHWRERLLSRFATCMADVLDRVHFIPRQSRSGFLQLLMQADVMLDPIHYGGTNTTYEGLAMGVPIVTMPTPYLKGRITLGCYRKMGWLEGVVDSPESYVNLAVKLGTDPVYWANFKAEILARCHVLYEDMAAVHELTQFFKQAIQQSACQSVS